MECLFNQVVGREFFLVPYFRNISCLRKILQLRLISRFMRDAVTRCKGLMFLFCGSVAWDQFLTTKRIIYCDRMLKQEREYIKSFRSSLASALGKIKRREKKIETMKRENDILRVDVADGEKYINQTRERIGALKKLKKK